MANIGIIGAGISGLSVAARLTGLGHHCTVFEKSRGLGGRLARRKLPWGQLDIGAPFLTPTLEETHDRLAHFCRAGILSRGRLQRARLVSGTLHEAPAIKAYWANHSNNEICHALAETVKVIRQRRIAAIAASANGIIHLSDDQRGSCGDFDAVILSAPAPQALALLPETSTLRGQDFPEMQPGWTVTLQFEEALGLFNHQQVIDFTADEPLVRGVDLATLRQGEPLHCYQFQLSAPFSQLCRDGNEAQTVEAVLAALARHSALPPLANTTVQPWNLCRLEKPGPALNILDSAHNLVLCGDWTAGDSGIDAALTSAERAVDAVTRLLERQRELQPPLYSP